MKIVNLPIIESTKDLWEYLQMDTPMHEVEKCGAIARNNWASWQHIVSGVVRIHKDKIIGDKTTKEFSRLSMFIQGACQKQTFLEDPDRTFSNNYGVKNNSIPYPCIPLHTSRFLELVRGALDIYKGKEKTRFIDAGCGVGDKVVLASMFFDYSCGVELSRFIASCGRSINRLSSRDELLEGDITTFDFSPYNIVYAYNPIQTYDGMYDFFKNLVKTASPGTVCMFANVDTGGQALDKVRKLKIGKRLVRSSGRYEDHIFVIK